ncbi:DEAD/DEAH box helicase [Candidatus Bathyarchaeota archaeon A05DMB-5]|jgi:superfamily II DNA/RNA helicase|nr:DEAD/DEAH box helicase [Candidatus Bathyarchaeota archaeon A05DMB-5]
MIVRESKPKLSELPISNFPFPKPFAHQYRFFENRNCDIILKSPTASGKTLCFLFSFINEYLKARQNNKRIKCLYLVPTRLLVQSQFESLRRNLERFAIPHRILESGYSFAELFKHVWENDFIVASPDIVFYILLRKKKTQHIEFEYTQLLKSLYCIVFDELHLFDTYTMLNIKNLIKIMKSQNPNLNVYLLSATMDLKDIIEPSSFVTIDGESLTYPIKVSAIVLNYLDTEEVAKFLKEKQFQRDTVYVCNSVDRAIRLHSYFADSALLVGKAWYETDEETREDQIKRNLEKCKEGSLTFATTVFRQGIDIDVKRLIVEEPLNSQDAIQTFGRCGRHGQSEFILLTNKSQLLSALNSDRQVSRGEFESILSELFKPPTFEEQKRMMNAMWYKLYTTTRLKDHVSVIITEQMKRDYEEFKDFLPDLGFREPTPSVKYEDIAFSIFEILAFKDAYLNIEPTDDIFFIGELRDGGRFVRREYQRAKKEELPIFTLVEKKRYKETPYYNLRLKLRNMSLLVNAKIGQLEDYPYILIDKTKLIPKHSSFKPCNFFE